MAKLTPEQQKEIDEAIRKHAVSITWLKIKIAYMHLVILEMVKLEKKNGKT